MSESAKMQNHSPTSSLAKTTTEYKFFWKMDEDSEKKNGEKIQKSKNQKIFLGDRRATKSTTHYSTTAVTAIAEKKIKSKKF